MPYVIPSYTPSFLLKEGHFGTILPYLFRRPPAIELIRTELRTPDGDFLHLEQSKKNNRRCALLVHGLEGSAQSSYILTLAQQLQLKGWDIAALHLRGCSGVPNLLYRSYNSGSTDDLETAIQHIENQYDKIAVIGFSLGGNIVLRYTGEKSSTISKKLVASIGISVPCHLSSACSKMEDAANWLYTYRFVSSLKKKLQSKMDLHPHKVLKKTYQNIKTIKQLDDAYTAPANGYRDAEDYYAHCSCLFVLDKIAIPTLLINAQDDPFLSLLCFPEHIASTNSNLHLYAPKYGGHVGFWPEKRGAMWKHEEWTLDFLQKVELDQL